MNRYVQVKLRYQINVAYLSKVILPSEQRPDRFFEIIMRPDTMKVMFQNNQFKFSLLFHKFLCSQ